MNGLQRWNSSLARASRRWGGWAAACLLSIGVGGWLGSGPWHEDIQALFRLHDEMTALTVQLRAGESPTQPVSVDGDAWGDLPDARQADQVWTWLQQGLHLHGLQVQALRPGAPQSHAGAMTQPLVLQVQGRWRDWRVFERELDRLAPWWTWTQWQVTPIDMPGQVRMQWQSRWSWRAPAASTPPVVLPDWTEPRTQEQAQLGGQEVFGRATVQQESAQASAPASDSAAQWPDDPALWPVQALRLQGIWWQAGVAHAVLGQGLRQHTVVPGQRLGREGYTVHQVDRDGVVLRAPQSSAPPVHLTWTGDVK